MGGTQPFHVTVFLYRLDALKRSWVALSEVVGLLKPVFGIGARRKAMRDCFKTFLTGLKLAAISLTGFRDPGIGSISFVTSGNGAALSALVCGPAAPLGGE